MGIVSLLCFTIAPIPPGILMAFFIGGVLLVLGMMFFTLGAEMAMTPMGERIGMRLTQMKNVWVVVLLSFILGFIITISEPDLQVLAEQVPSVPNYILILAVAAICCWPCIRWYLSWPLSCRRILWRWRSTPEG